MNEEMLNRLEAALAEGHLRELVKELVDEGKSQVQIYCIVDKFSDFLRESDREKDIPDVFDLMDEIIGWCGESHRLFDHYLDNEEIDAYRREHGD
jgi:hypothetical protein